jgi:hypothetical protein
MTETGPNAELAALKSAIEELEQRFLNAHLGAPALAIPSRDEMLDVAAYVVLAHGALENFVEGLALWILDRLVDDWTKHKKTTLCTTALLLYQPNPENNDSQRSVFDLIRVALDQAKDRVSKLVHDNNGVTTRHVQTLLLPLGINVPTDLVLTGSLEWVVSIRHEWAHRYRYNKTTIAASAEDARRAVSDCLTFAKKMVDEANFLLP